MQLQQPTPQQHHRKRPYYISAKKTFRLKVIVAVLRVAGRRRMSAHCISDGVRLFYTEHKLYPRGLSCFAALIFVYDILLVVVAITTNNKHGNNTQ